MKIEKEIIPVINIKNEHDTVVANIKNGRLNIVGTSHSINIKAIYYTIAYKPDTDVFSSFTIESTCNSNYIRVTFTDSDTAQVNIFDTYYNIVFSIDRAILKEAVDTIFSIENKVSKCINNDTAEII